MAASSSDKFRKVARKWVGQVGAAGVGDASVTTLPLASATGLPTDTAIDLVFQRVDSSGTKTPTSEETATVVVSGDNGTNAVRGEEGTAQAHAAGTVVENLITANGWNDIVDGILVEHDQDGTHDKTKVVDLTTAQTLTNKTLTSPVLNTGVSGTAILDEDNMASDSATQVPTQQSVKAYVDTEIAGIDVGSDGWTASSDTWVYVSASTFKIVGADRTTVFTKGTRLKFTQTTAKYAVVVASAFSTDTTVTIAVNTDYTIANAAITSPYYSYQANPQGYPAFFTYTSTVSYAGGSADPTSMSIVAKFNIVGATCNLIVSLTLTRGSGDRTFTSFTLPVNYVYIGNGAVSGTFVVSNTAPYGSYGSGSSGALTIYHGAMTRDGWMYINLTYII